MLVERRLQAAPYPAHCSSAHPSFLSVPPIAHLLSHPPLRSLLPASFSPPASFSTAGFVLSPRLRSLPPASFCVPPMLVGSALAARFARESHLSVRRGYWFMPRSVAGIPAVELLNPFFPLWLVRVSGNFGIRALRAVAHITPRAHSLFALATDRAAGPAARHRRHVLAVRSARAGPQDLGAPPDDQLGAAAVHQGASAPETTTHPAPNPVPVFCRAVAGTDSRWERHAWTAGRDQAAPGHSPLLWRQDRRVCGWHQARL